MNGKHTGRVSRRNSTSAQSLALAWAALVPAAAASLELATEPAGGASAVVAC